MELRPGAPHGPSIPREEAEKMRWPWGPENPASLALGRALSASQVIFYRSLNCKSDADRLPVGLSAAPCPSG